MSSLDRHLSRAISTAKFLLEKEWQVCPPVKEEPQQKHVWDAAKKLVVTLPQEQPQQQPDWDPCQSPIGNSSHLVKLQSSKTCASPEPQQLSPKASLPGRLSSQSSGVREDALVPQGLHNAAQERDMRTGGAFRRSASSTLQCTARSAADVGTTCNFRRSASSNMQGTAQQQRDPVAAFRSTSSFVKSELQLLKHSTAAATETSSAAVQAAEQEDQQNPSSRTKGAAMPSIDNSLGKSRVSFADDPDSPPPGCKTCRHTDSARNSSAFLSQPAALPTIISSSGGTRLGSDQQQQEEDDTGLFGGLIAADSALDFLRRIQTDTPGGCYSPSYHRSRSANLPPWESATTMAAEANAEQPSDLKYLRRGHSEMTRSAEPCGHVSPTTAVAAGYRRPPLLRIDTSAEASAASTNSCGTKRGLGPAGSTTAASRTKPVENGQGPRLARLGSRGTTSTAAALASAAAADSVLHRRGSTGQLNAALRSSYGLQRQVSKEDASDAAMATTITTSPAKARVNSGHHIKPSNNHRTGYKNEGLGFKPHEAPVSLLNERVPIAASEFDSTRYDRVLGAMNRETAAATESNGVQAHWHGH